MEEPTLIDSGSIREALDRLREADEDDHYYGAWMGGSKASGGFAVPAKGKGEPFDKAAFQDEVQQRQVEAAERAVRDIPDHEELVIVGATRRRGEKTYVQVGNTGGETSVSLTPAVQAVAMDGHIVHNHPGDGGFSDKDIATAIVTNAKSVTAIGTDAYGNKVRYRLYRPKNGWDRRDRMGATMFWQVGMGASSTREWRSVFARERGRVESEFRTKLLLARTRSDAKAVKRAVDYANSQYMHRVMTAVAKERGWRYERTGWDGGKVGTPSEY